MQTLLQEDAAAQTQDTFTQVAEICMRHSRFIKGGGLPGKAWAGGRPVVLRSLDGSDFKRAAAAAEAGLTASDDRMVALPLHDNKEIAQIVAWYS